ncbi:hypothetical protein [Paracoccus isoporae]|uniref:hypothetical protein n=1 Tax=Paracoccus isoporae TaxID=591205 RepID=UPI00115F919A|nr:hypothetical protein [Paracoccus isoporae]
MESRKSPLARIRVVRHVSAGCHDAGVRLRKYRQISADPWAGRAEIGLSAALLTEKTPRRRLVDPEISADRLRR